jgi:regulator of nonsense transcripts 1
VLIILFYFQESSKTRTMEGAFTHLGNHLISDSAAAINAGADDLSNIDPDESLLYGQYGGRGGLGPSRRRNDDDDNETEVFDDDDAESLASIPVDGMKTLGLRGVEDEKELPAHACA